MQCLVKCPIFSKYVYKQKKSVSKFRILTCAPAQFCYDIAWKLEYLTNVSVHTLPLIVIRVW